MNASIVEKSSPCYLITEARNKPQSHFQHVLADNSYNQFKHFMPSQKGGGDRENVHPYKDEIEELLNILKTEFVELFDCGKVTRIEDTECVWVETTSQLEDLVETVFGVDTEQHTLRSYLGFTALIQISTTSKDYLVDAIALHDVMGILRPVFANPRICKVFHGAGNDILWLQRDFHIYVVNLFDTAKASDLLWTDPKSFAYLVERYFKVSKNTALTRGDWTGRPLCGEMVEYARIDSHYLLPVANRVVMELKENSIDLVLMNIYRSNKACLQLYKRETKEAYLGESKAESIITCYLNNQAEIPCDTKLRMFQSCVRRLCGWREVMGRVHDESLSFILSDQAISAIAATLSTTEADLHDTICRADNSNSPSLAVCSHFEDFGMLLFPDSASATEDDDLGHSILQWCLGSKGNCPLSSYNDNMLSNTIPKLSKRLLVRASNTRADRRQKRSAEMCGGGCHLTLRAAAEVRSAAKEYCKREMVEEFRKPVDEEIGAVSKAALNLLLGPLNPRSKLPPNKLEEYKKKVTMHYGREVITIEDLQRVCLVGLHKRQLRKKFKILQLQHLTGHNLATLQSIGIFHDAENTKDLFFGWNI